MKVFAHSRNMLLALRSPQLFELKKKQQNQVTLFIVNSVKSWLLNISCKTKVLATNSVAAKDHGLHVYLQVREWKESAGALHLADWEWQEYEKEFVLLQTSLPLAPQHLLRM